MAEQSVPTQAKQSTGPWSMSFAAWKDVLVRSWREAGDDNIGIIAAGVAFYGFLALVPLLGAIVLSYGLVASPETVVRNMKAMTSVVPADAAKLIGDQLMNVVKTSGGKKGLGVLIALAIALFGARNGAGSVITALNVAYDEKEKRNFIIVNLLALAITAGAVLAAIIAVIAIAALGHLEKALPGAPALLLALGKIVTYVLLGCGGATAAAVLYRYGPSRPNARWTWITPGSLLSALFWLALTLGFGVYVAKFGNYNATYGSLGAVIVLLTWMYLSSYILLFGAELNSDLDNQSAAKATEPGTSGKSGSADGRLLTPSPAERQRGGANRAQSASFPADLVAARVSLRAARTLGSRKVGLISSSVATLGLSLLRKRGRAGPGVILIGLAAAAAWVTREHERTDATRHIYP